MNNNYFNAINIPKSQYATDIIKNQLTYNSNNKIFFINPNINISTKSIKNLYKEYIDTLPMNLDVFSKVEAHIGEIDDQAIQKVIIQFVTRFNYVLKDLADSRVVYNALPPLSLDIDEDTAFLEWIFKDFRIGFSLHKNEDQSTWFLITNRNLEEITVFGDLYKDDKFSTIKRVLKYVLENT